LTIKRYESSYKGGFSGNSVTYPKIWKDLVENSHKFEYNELAKNFEKILKSDVYKEFPNLMQFFINVYVKNMGLTLMKRFTVISSQKLKECL